MSLAAPGGSQARPGDAGSAPRGGAKLALERVGTFSSPTYLENAPGRPRLLFVTELGGTVRVLRKRNVLAQPFLDLRAEVLSGGERGLLSIAFDPDYRHNRRFYVAYVNRDNDLQVDRFRTSPGHPAQALPRSGRTVIVVPHPREQYHYGGQLAFGPEGALYVSTGDGWPGDPFDNAQDPESLLGKILRIIPGTRNSYRPYPANPFVGTAGRDEIFALGLRNPARFSFEGDSLWLADVGQQRWEEIDRISVTADAGANFGWSRFEGSAPYKATPFEPPPPRYRPPIYEYANTGDACAVIGGYVVRDPALSTLAGSYVFADFCDGILRRFIPASDVAPARAEPLGLRVPVPTSFGEGVRGRIYIASLEGDLFQLVQTGG